jgi:alpha-glucosidase
VKNKTIENILRLVFTAGLVIACPMSAQQRSTPAESAAAAKPDMDDIWWKHTVVYEIYPRSFGDTNGDGTGDLNGITQHLDYLKQLGIDTIWIAPLFPSPQADFGYDISDYRAIDPQYGTMADFDRLSAEAQKLGMHLVLDMVLNHTSDKHPFFIESASSKNNAKADWYVWNDGIPATTPGLSTQQKSNAHTGPSGEVVPPNNWLSFFGGSAWEWMPQRQQFYYHAFLKAQPDVNWRNPAVEKEMFSAIKLWLDKGVSGFRLDAIQTLFEDSQLRDNPKDAGIFSGRNANQPEVHDVIRRLRAMLNTYPAHPVLIGELVEPTSAGLDSWYGGTARDQFQLPMDYIFGFPAMATETLGVKTELSASYYRQQLLNVESQIHGSQPFLFFDNHDNMRSLTRFGDGVHDLAIAKVVAALLLTPRATPQTYYGAEIGMPDSPPTRKEDVRDPWGLTGWPTYKGRDGERTPMQWTPGPQAGFSTNPQTWLPISSGYKTTNVQTETSDADSLLNWYKSLISLRSSNSALRYGGMVMVDKENPNVLSFVRTAPIGSEPLLIVMNMTSTTQTSTVDLTGIAVKPGQLHTLLSAPKIDNLVSLGRIELPPYAVVIATIH